jgi:hypothetical protein
MKTVYMAEDTLNEIKKIHKSCVGQITPLTSVDGSAQFVLEKYFDKVDNKIYEIDQGLIWKNLQYLINHNNNEIKYHLEQYDETIKKCFEKLNFNLKYFEDYRVKFNWKISLASIVYLSNAKKYYERSFRDFTIFINKNCKYKEIRTY